MEKYVEFLGQKYNFSFKYSDSVTSSGFVINTISNLAFYTIANLALEPELSLQ